MKGRCSSFSGRSPTHSPTRKTPSPGSKRKGQNNGSTTRGHSDGISIEALDHVIALKKLLESWAQMLREETREGTTEDPARYLRANLREITQHDWAGDMLTELTEAHQNVERAVDTRQEVVILQRCGTLLEDGDTLRSQAQTARQGTAMGQVPQLWLLVLSRRRPTRASTPKRAGNQ